MIFLFCNDLRFLSIGWRIVRGINAWIGLSIGLLFLSWTRPGWALSYMAGRLTGA